MNGMLPDLSSPSSRASTSMMTGLFWGTFKYASFISRVTSSRSRAWARGPPLFPAVSEHPYSPADLAPFYRGRKFRAQMLAFGESCIFFKPTKYKGDLQWQRGIWVGLSEKNGAHVLLTPEGAVESRSVRRVPEENQWDSDGVVSARGLLWDYGNKSKRKRPLYTGRTPDSASLEELAKAAGRAAAESIAAGTPRPPVQDEAGSDETSSSSSLSVESPSPIEVPTEQAKAKSSSHRRGESKSSSRSKGESRNSCHSKGEKQKQFPQQRRK